MNGIDWISVAMIVFVIALAVIGISGQNIFHLINVWLVPDRKTENDIYDITNE